MIDSKEPYIEVCVLDQHVHPKWPYWAQKVKGLRNNCQYY